MTNDCDMRDLETLWDIQETFELTLRTVDSAGLTGAVGYIDPATA
jgi:hypothetical protein